MVDIGKGVGSLSSVFMVSFLCKAGDQNPAPTHYPANLTMSLLAMTRLAAYQGSDSTSVRFGPNFRHLAGLFGWLCGDDVKGV